MVWRVRSMGKIVTRGKNTFTMKKMTADGREIKGRIFMQLSPGRTKGERYIGGQMERAEFWRPKKAVSVQITIGIQLTVWWKCEILWRKNRTYRFRGRRNCRSKYIWLELSFRAKHFPPIVQFERQTSMKMYKLDKIELNMTKCLRNVTKDSYDHIYSSGRCVAAYIESREARSFLHEIIVEPNISPKKYTKRFYLTSFIN